MLNPAPAQMPLHMVGSNDSRERPESRRAVLIQDLEQRLKTVCADWPAELFRSMVEGLADITLKYDRISGISVGERRNSDQLVADLKHALARSERARDEEPS